MPFGLIAALLVSVAASPAAAQPAASNYVLRYDAATETMAVRVCVPYASPQLRFTTDSDAWRYIDQMTRENGAAPVREAHGWSAADWHAGECISYRAALGRIANLRGEGGTRRGTDLLIEPQKWLLRTAGATDEPPAEVRVELPPGFSMSAPWHPLPSTDGARRFAIPPTPDDWIARIAIGRFDEVPIEVPGGVLRLAMLGSSEVAERDKIVAWIRRVTRATLSAFGRLPLADVQLLVLPSSVAWAGPGGESTRGQGHALLLSLDPAQSAEALDQSWVAVHELSHMFHPYLGDRGSWLSEGLATYYQNVLRARAGLLTAAQAWEQIDAGFGRGRSATRPDDKDTLERASESDERPNFMRIYWSGTAYWLEVDTELRRVSANRLSVDEALRRFDACCLPDYRGWEPEDFVAKLDALLNTDVFRKRYATYRERRDFPDLAPLYAGLGIRRDGNTLQFVDDAPAADVRRAITSAH